MTDLSAFSADQLAEKVLAAWNEACKPMEAHYRYPLEYERFAELVRRASERDRLRKELSGVIRESGKSRAMLAAERDQAVRLAEDRRKGMVVTHNMLTRCEAEARRLREALEQGDALVSQAHDLLYDVPLPEQATEAHRSELNRRIWAIHECLRSALAAGGGKTEE